MSAQKGLRTVSFFFSYQVFLLMVGCKSKAQRAGLSPVLLSSIEEATRYVQVEQITFRRERIRRLFDGTRLPKKKRKGGEGGINTTGKKTVGLGCQGRPCVQMDRWNDVAVSKLFFGGAGVNVGSNE